MGPGDGQPDPQELADELEQRERAQRRLADDAEEPAEVAAHERRAEKTEYLREKLIEQAEADREAD